MIGGWEEGEERMRRRRMGWLEKREPTLRGGGKKTIKPTRFYLVRIRRRTPPFSAISIYITAHARNTPPLFGNWGQGPGVGWLGWLAGWAGRLGWLAGWLGGWAGWLAGLAGWLAGWVAGLAGLGWLG